MPGKLPLSALGIMLFCNVAWAMNVVVSKIAVTTLGLPPLFYTVLRSATVLAVLFPLLRFVPQRPLLVLVIGFAITGGSFGLQFIGLQTASPSAVGIVNLSGAPLTVLFAIIFLGEEVRWRRGLGMALALGGVGLAIGAPSDAGDPVGLGFAFAGVFIGAFALVFVKRLEVGAVAVQAWAAVAWAMLATASSETPPCAPLTTPATRRSASAAFTVTSADPPNTTTVPGA
jgi:O-acetylserine/cysteine efflux transporter